MKVLKTPGDRPYVFADATSTEKMPIVDGFRRTVNLGSPPKKHDPVTQGLEDALAIGLERPGFDGQTAIMNWVR